MKIPSSRRPWFLRAFILHPIEFSRSRTPPRTFRRFLPFFPLLSENTAAATTIRLLLIYLFFLLLLLILFSISHRRIPRRPSLSYTMVRSVVAVWEHALSFIFSLNASFVPRVAQTPAFSRLICKSIVPRIDRKILLRAIFSLEVASCMFASQIKRAIVKDIGGVINTRTHRDLKKLVVTPRWGFRRLKRLPSYRKPNIAAQIENGDIFPEFHFR